MIAQESLPTPAFGHDGQPCPACSAPLAGDQRYCLHCGARRPEARLEFLDVLDADVRASSAVVPVPAAAFTAASASAAGGGLNARLQANSGALALGAVLLLTLLVGLLVGHWVTAGAPVAASAPAAPQVIRLEGAGATAPAATAATATSAGSSGAAGATKHAAAHQHAAKDSSAGASAPKDAVSVKKLAGDKKAIEKAVKKGKPIATGGKPLPKDNKAAGGGSSFETIG